jgi:hypothetical protein
VHRLSSKSRSWTKYCSDGNLSRSCPESHFTEACLQINTKTESPYSRYWDLKPTIFEANPKFIFHIWALNCGQHLNQSDVALCFIEWRDWCGVTHRPTEEVGVVEVACWVDGVKVLCLRTYFLTFWAVFDQFGSIWTIFWGSFSTFLHFPDFSRRYTRK